MNLLTRITATLTGKVEEMVAQVENHEAIVAVALKDTRAAVAKAKIRLDRVHKDGESLQKKQQEATQMQTVWEERARNIAAEDEAKALECMARRNHCREQAVQLHTMLTRHAEMESKLTEEVRHMEQRLAQLTQQQNLMRSRQSTAEAMRIISQIENHSGNGIEDIFDRWEIRIAEAEYSSGTSSEVDTLERSFAKTEHNDQLKADLSALLTKKE
jgi:phage shock protein A